MQLKIGENLLSDLENLTSFKTSEQGLFNFSNQDFKSLSEFLKGDVLFDLILQHIDKMHKTSNFSSFQAFLDGKPYDEYKSDQLLTFNRHNISTKLSTLPCSIKLTGFQLISSQIRALTSNVFLEHDFPMTCNMYITPPNNKNAFNYHVDPHKVYIMQLMGEKNWSFPLLENSGRHVFHPDNLQGNNFNEYKSIAELKLTEGDALYISKGTLHRAFQVGDSPSIHLSFAGLQSDSWQFLTFLSHKLLSFESHEIEEMMNDTDLSVFNMSKIYDKLSLKLQSLNAQSEIKIFRKIKAEENLFIAKRGRPYSLEALKLFQALSKID